MSDEHPVSAWERNIVLEKQNEILRSHWHEGGYIVKCEDELAAARSIGLQAFRERDEAREKLKSIVGAWQKVRDSGLGKMLPKWWEQYHEEAMAIYNFDYSICDYLDAEGEEGRPDPPMCSCPDWMHHGENNK